MPAPWRATPGTTGTPSSFSSLDAFLAGAPINYRVTRGTPGLLRIPPGVWHASQNWGDFEAVCMNFPTRSFDPEHPDKYRIDPASGEIPFDFTLRDG